MSTMAREHDQRIREVFSRVLRVPPDAVTDDLRRGSMEEWDSLGHVMLVSALGKEFSVHVTPEAALGMHTVADVKRIIGELARDGRGNNPGEA
jgi:acyl carrier protein